MSEEKEQEEKDTELDLIAEQELLRLTRQFRVSRLLSVSNETSLQVPKRPQTELDTRNETCFLAQLMCNVVM